MSTCRTMLPFGGAAELAALPQMLGQRIDQLLVASLLPAAEMGYCGWSCLGGGLTLASSAVTALVFPTVAAMTTRNARRVYIRQAGGRGLFGVSFGPAVRMAEVLLLGMCLQGAVDLLQVALKGIRKPSAVFRGRSISLCIAVVFMIVLLPRYGAVGAAMAFVVGQAFLTLLLARAWSAARED